MQPKRDTTILVRLNDDEATQMDTERRALGLSRSAYMRMVLLEHLQKRSEHKKDDPGNTKISD